MYIHTVLSILASAAVVAASGCGANIPGVDLSGYSVQTEGSVRASVYIPPSAHHISTNKTTVSLPGRY